MASFIMPGKSGVGVDYSAVSSTVKVDKRFQRNVAQSTIKPKENQSSSTMDALTRMAAGVDGRTLAQKMADPNRPTWEQYKKDNEDKLDNSNKEAKQMEAYRKELDAERDRKLAQAGSAGKRKVHIESSSESDSSNSDADSDSTNSERKKKRKKDKKEKKEKKKRKKEKKDKKEKKERREKKEKKARKE